MPTVLFIDDDDSLIRLYQKKVATLPVEIRFEDTVDGALRYLREGGSADIIVWDMSMPPGMEFDDNDTHGGLRTGRYLYPIMTELRPDAQFILLTNRTEVIGEYHVPTSNSYAYAKLATSPDYLKEIIAQRLGITVAYSRDGK